MSEEEHICYIEGESIFESTVAVAVAENPDGPWRPANEGESVLPVRMHLGRCYECGAESRSWERLVLE